jgi:hypothetical protein
VLDAWTVTGPRGTFAWDVVGAVGGVAAPLFLFLAGLAVPLAGEARLRRGGAVRDAAWALQKRGWQIFALAHVFRLQSFLLNPNARWHAILKPDILNILGVGLVVTAFLWGRARQRDAARRWIWWLVPAAVVLMLTPLSPHWWWPTLLHPRLEAYIRPVNGYGVFTLFPALAFVFAGGWIGEAVATPRAAAAEPGFHLRLAAIGSGLVAAGLALGVAPALVPWLAAWTADAANFVWRAGMLIVMLAIAWRWTRRFPPAPSNALVTFGRTSLVVYWVHVELAYGIFSYPLHHALPLRWSLAGLAAMVALMLALARWWEADRPRLAVPAHMSA